MTSEIHTLVIGQALTGRAAYRRPVHPPTSSALPFPRGTVRTPRTRSRAKTLDRQAS
jgi:hypothetical protein